MNKISTPSFVSTSVDQIKGTRPKQATLEFIRQFARVYQSAKVTTLSETPGFVLN
jgi:hypothetical protein